jgi:hypothetical protein
VVATEERYVEGDTFKFTSDFRKLSEVLDSASLKFEVRLLVLEEEVRRWKI